MNALDEVFARTRSEDRAALIAYLPAGYPDLETSIASVRALAEEGVDIVEVGVPYTDPLMDGPVVEQAAAASLRAGFRLGHVFDVVRAVHEAGAVPVVMSYWNPVLRYGPDRFAADLAAAGGAGMITPDLVPDEGAAWRSAAADNGLAPIFLVAPSSTTERLTMTTQACGGFVYVASTMGVTGVRATVGDSARTLVERTRAVTDLPLAVGLGVSTGDQAAEVAGFADGVIVGSALVRALTADPTLGDLRSLTRELAQGVRRR